MNQRLFHPIHGGFACQSTYAAGISCWLFNGNQLRFFFHFLLGFLWNKQLQNAILEACFDVLLLQLFAYIEGSLAGTRVAFLSYIAVFLIFFILILSFLSRDGQIAVF